MISFSEREGCLIFTVRVVPRASKSEIVGEHNGALKIRLAAPPVDGAANAELVKTLAKAFNVSNKSVEIISGKASKTKQIKVENITGKQLLILTENITLKKSATEILFLMSKALLWTKP